MPGAVVPDALVRQQRCPRRVTALQSWLAVSARIPPSMFRLENCPPGVGDVGHVVLVPWRRGAGARGGEVRPSRAGEVFFFRTEPAPRRVEGRQGPGTERKILARAREGAGRRTR